MQDDPEPGDSPPPTAHARQGELPVVALAAFAICVCILLFMLFQILQQMGS